MPKYSIHGSVVASTYVGEYEAESKEKAIEMAWKDASVSVCHQCSSRVEEPEIDELYAEEIEED